MADRECATYPVAGGSTLSMRHNWDDTCRLWRQPRLIGAPSSQLCP